LTFLRTSINNNKTYIFDFIGLNSQMQWIRLYYSLPGFHRLSHISHFNPTDHEWKCIFPGCEQRNIRPISVSRIQHWRNCNSHHKGQSHR